MRKNQQFQKGIPSCGLYSILSICFMVLLLSMNCSLGDEIEPRVIYTVSFNADGGTPAPSKQEIAKGDKVSEPSAITRTGYTFDGWYKETAFINKWNFTGDTVTNNITLHAKWNPLPAYTVDFDSDGGSTAPAQQTVYQNDKVTEPSAMTKTGYTFEGWYKENTFTNQWDFQINVVSGNITLYAKWKPLDIFTVIFYANGGNPVPTQQTIMENGKVTAPSVMTKTGYTFEGWYREATLSDKWDFATDTVTANTTLYARWNGNPYIITYDANGGSGSMTVSNLIYGTPQKLNENTFTRVGYIFMGWATSSTGDVIYTDQQEVNDLGSTAGITVPLYAVWKEAVEIVPGTSVANKLTWLQSNSASNTIYIIEVNSNEDLSPQTLSYSNKTNITIRLTGIDTIRVINLSSNGSMFTVKSGVILVLDSNITLKGRSGNNAPLVYVDSGSNLIMKNGTNIIDNTVNNSEAGGVRVNGGTFIMDGGIISGGGGVSLGAGGQGVAVWNADGKFIMNDGTISGNSGGVYVNRGTFTMNGGTISGNRATFDGGGVYIENNATFAMDGGTIKGNSAGRNGGGVYIVLSVFTKTGGSMIYGYSVTDTVNNNAVKSSTGTVYSNAGHAICAAITGGSIKMRKENTAGLNQNLSCDTRSSFSLTYSGDWDYHP